MRFVGYGLLATALDLAASSKTRPLFAYRCLMLRHRNRESGSDVMFRGAYQSDDEVAWRRERQPMSVEMTMSNAAFSLPARAANAKSSMFSV